MSTAPRRRTTAVTTRSTTSTIRSATRSSTISSTSDNREDSVIDTYPELSFASQREWEEWLEANHDSARGAWLLLAKKGAPTPTVTYAEAVDTALCYGWIDSQKKRFDAHFSLQKFTPRGRRSVWSKINREKVARLEAEGQMRPSGRRAVDAAKADGRWDAAYDPPSTAEVPDDLASALEANAEAGAFFQTLNSANRYAVLWRIQTAKRPETRARRIAELVAMLGRREKLHD